MAQENPMENDKVYVLAIGQSGAGKSSHLRLLTGDKSIKTSSQNDENRCTTEATCYPSSKKNGTYKGSEMFVDTQGTQDSKNNKTDNEILCELGQTIQLLYDRGNCNKIKILWFIKQEDKKSPALQTEAKFIESLQKSNNNNNNSIWKSVCIICKNPSYDIDNAINGALSAANVSKNKELIGSIVGYSCYEWVSEKIQKKFSKYDNEQLDDMNIKKENNVLLLLSDIISNKLLSHKIFFKNYKCNKCGIIGDPKFTSKTSKCHLNGIKKHSNIHHKKHNGSLKLEKILTGTRTVRKCPACNSTDISPRKCTLGGSFLWWTSACGTCNRLIATGESFWDCNRCCSRGHGTSMDPCCARCNNCTKKVENIYKTQYRYSICDCLNTSQGCIRYCSNCDKKIDYTVGCINICGNGHCGKKLGNTKGCTIGANHDWHPL